MSNSQKGSPRFAVEAGFAPIIIILGIVLIFGVIGGAYFFSKNSNTAVKNNPVITQTPTFTPTVTPKTDETANWKTYIDQTFSYSIQYPQNWELKITKDALDIPTIHLKIINQPKRSYSTEIYVGGSGVYSTSGAICANAKCEKIDSLSLSIEKEQIDLSIFKMSSSPSISPIYRLQFELPQKFGETISDWSSPLIPVVTATYNTDEERIELTKIFSTFRSN